MVEANSQLAHVHGLLINSVNNSALYVEMVHNTDDDTV